MVVIFPSELTADTFPIEFWENGRVYFHNHDKDNHKICKKYDFVCLIGFISTLNSCGNVGMVSYPNHTVPGEASHRQFISTG